MVWKNYPLRKDKGDETRKQAEKIVDVCTCGHGSFNHTREGDVKGGCDECLCLLFEYQASMSINDLIKMDFQRRGIKVE